MYCSKCGNELEEGQRECSKCGNQVRNKKINKLNKIDKIVNITCIIILMIITFSSVKTIVDGMTAESFVVRTNSTNSGFDYVMVSEKILNKGIAKVQKEWGDVSEVIGVVYNSRTKVQKYIVAHETYDVLLGTNTYYMYTIDGKTGRAEKINVTAYKVYGIENALKEGANFVATDEDKIGVFTYK